jgi:hypothetical protein
MILAGAAALALSAAPAFAQTSGMDTQAPMHRGASASSHTVGGVGDGSAAGMTSAPASQGRGDRMMSRNEGRRMGHESSQWAADHSADQLNAKELASTQDGNGTDATGMHGASTSGAKASSHSAM